MYFNIFHKRLRHFQEAVDIAAFSSLLAHKRAELPHHSQIDFLYLLDVRLLLTKAQKRLRLFRYPRMVFGVYFLTSISIKYSLIAALIFMSIPPLVCRNQRGMYITAQSMYFAAEKNQFRKCAVLLKINFFPQESSINPAASYARRSARPRCHPACPAASSCCGRHPRWSW